MLQSILLAVMMLVAQPATAPSAGPASNPTLDRDAVLKAIDHFLAAPTPGADMQTIIQFAQESDDVTVAIDHAIAPWLNHQPIYPQESVFLAAFIAGDVKAQLLSHKKGDDPYPGLQAVIQTYEMMSQTDKNLQIPEIEKFVEMEKRGELKAHVDQIVKERKK